MTHEILHKLSPLPALLLSLLVIPSTMLSAQTPPAQGNATQTATAAAAPQLSFDVVSIRRNTSGSRQMTRQSAADTDDITMTNVPLGAVVFYAYYINNENLVTGIPDWAWSERYDVVAKVAPSDLAAYRALTNRQRAAMLQKVLADRCKLQVHRETKDMPVYALVVAKGGPRLKEALSGELHPNTAKSNPGGFVHGATIFATGPGQLTGEAASMADLALALSNSERESLGRIVVDKTGLTGKYDFTLQIAPDQTGAKPDGADGQQDAAPGTSGPSIFTALQEQLGLRLQSTTSPTEYLVIDHIERPSEN
jgi:uncharacterized protein (TIGR03435 family)